MKAVVFEKYGGYDVLEYKEIPTPKAGPGEALVKVKAIGCNYNDVWGRRGEPMKVPLPHISGSDASGIVEQVGPGVTNVKVGDEVIVHSAMPAYGRREGQEYNIWGFESGPLQGAMGEYFTVPAESLLPKPKNLTHEEAASLGLVLVTVWRMLVSKGGIRPGDYVLIWGAAGGLGVFAIQVCKLFRAHAIAVASSDEKLERCKELGAEFLINRKTQDISQELRKIVGRRGVDIVFEHPGAATIGLSLRLAKWGGKVISCGATSGYDANIDLRHIFFRQVSLIGSTMGTVNELADALKMVEEGHIKPVIHKILPLSEAGEAERLIEEDEAVGKVILVP